MRSDIRLLLMCISLFLCAGALSPGFLFTGAVMLYAQEEEGEAEKIEQMLDSYMGKWKKNFAAPSFGVVLYEARLRGSSWQDFSSSIGEAEYVTPALDMRILRGINITKRGGFYSGFEAGVLLFLPYEKSFTDTVSVTDNNVPVPPYIWNKSFTFKTMPHGGSVFLMMKYGYRLDIGPPAFGVSGGLELGLGASLFSGGYDVFVGSRDKPAAEAGFSTGRTEITIASDIAAEAALRLGRNFRFFCKAGMTVTPMRTERDFDGMDISGVLDDGIVNSDAEYLRFALKNYKLDVEGFGLSMRAGFALNFH